MHSPDAAFDALMRRRKGQRVQQQPHQAGDRDTGLGWGPRALPGQCKAPRCCPEDKYHGRCHLSTPPWWQTQRGFSRDTGSSVFGTGTVAFEVTCLELSPGSSAQPDWELAGENILKSCTLTETAQPRLQKTAQQPAPQFWCAREQEQRWGLIQAGSSLFFPTSLSPSLNLSHTLTTPLIQLRPVAREKKAKQKQKTT